MTTRPEASARRAAPSRRRIAAFVALWASIGGAALLAPGCYGQNCDGGIEVFGPDAGQGYMVDETTWASGRWDETWLWFPRQRYYVFEIPALGGRTPEKIVPYISGSPNPLRSGGHLTPGSGNLAEIFAVSPNRVDIKNDTCSDYFLRLVVEVSPHPPPAPALDGGATADAGIVDASEEAGHDASDGASEAGP